MKPYQFIASFSGIGYIRGGGSIAAAVTSLVYYFVMPKDIFCLGMLITGVFFAGVMVSNRADSEWGKDSSKVVVDEVFGMLISVYLHPNSPFVLIGCFILFRFFDILKPLGIRKTERLPRGWGVMADDFLAGIYANLSMFVILYFLK